MDPMDYNHIEGFERRSKPERPPTPYRQSADAEMPTADNPDDIIVISSDDEYEVPQQRRTNVAQQETQMKQEPINSELIDTEATDTTQMETHDSNGAANTNEPNGLEVLNNVYADEQDDANEIEALFESPPPLAHTEHGVSPDSGRVSFQSSGVASNYMPMSPEIGDFRLDLFNTVPKRNEPNRNANERPRKIQSVISHSNHSPSIGRAVASQMTITNRAQLNQRDSHYNPPQNQTQNCCHTFANVNPSVQQSHTSNNLMHPSSPSYHPQIGTNMQQMPNTGFNANVNNNAFSHTHNISSSTATQQQFAPNQSVPIGVDSTMNYSNVVNPQMMPCPSVQFQNCQQMNQNNFQPCNPQQNQQLPYQSPHVRTQPDGCKWTSQENLYQQPFQSRYQSPQYSPYPDSYQSPNIHNLPRAVNQPKMEFKNACYNVHCGHQPNGNFAYAGNEQTFQSIPCQNPSFLTSIKRKFLTYRKCASASI